jgi:hypothetical protein
MRRVLLLSLSTFRSSKEPGPTSLFHFDPVFAEIVPVAASQTSHRIPTMADVQQEWPNRRNEILGSTLSIGFLSTIMLVWRVVYAIRNKRKLLFCDYLLVMAGVSTSIHKRRRLILTSNCSALM